MVENRNDVLLAHEDIISCECGLALSTVHTGPQFSQTVADQTHVGVAADQSEWGVLLPMVTFK